MVKGKCLAPECDFIVEDGQHIDDICQKLREHWRAQHPTKFFSHQRHAERAASYNMEWDEILANHFGPDWAAAGVDPENDRYFLSEISRSVHYSPEILAHAAGLLEVYNRNRQAEANAPGPVVAGGGGANLNAVRRRGRDRLLRFDAGPPAAPQAFVPPPGGFDEVMEVDEFDDGL